MDWTSRNAEIKTRHKKYAHLDDEMVVRATVISAKQWRYVNGEPVIAEGKFA